MTEKMIVACPECRTRFVAPLEKFLPNGRKVRCAKCAHAWFQQPEGKTDTAKPADPVTAQPIKPASTESIMDRATQAATSASVIERADQRRADLEASEQAIGTTSVQELEPATAPDEVPVSAGVAPSADATTFGNVAAMPQTPPVQIEEPRRFWPRALFYTAAAAIIAGVAGYFFKDQLSAQVPSLAPTLASWHDTVDETVSKVVPANRALRIDNVKYDFEDIEGGKALLVSAEVLNESAEAQDAPKLTMKILGDSGAILSEVDLAPEDLSTDIDAKARAPYFIRVPYPPEDLTRVEVDFAQ